MNMHTDPLTAYEQFWITVSAIHFPSLYHPQLYSSTGTRLNHPTFGVTVYADEFLADAPRPIRFDRVIHYSERFKRDLINLRGNNRPLVTERDGQYAELRKIFDYTELRNRARDSLFVGVPARLRVQPHVSKNEYGEKINVSVQEIEIACRDLKK